MSPPLLLANDLSVELSAERRTLQLVRGVSLQIEKGRTLCLVGESGCGKSMTALALLGLLPRGARATFSRLEMNGAPVSPSALRGRKAAIVFQEPMTALNPVFTVGDQLTAVHRRHHRSGQDAASARALALLERVGVPEPRRRLSQYPHELSGGLRQRALIAMALMCEPELLIADEPTTALDVTTQAQILRLLEDLQADMGLGLLLITHDLGVVARTAHRVAVMYAGKIVEAGEARDVLAAPRHPYTAGLLASVPHPSSGRSGTRRLGTIPGRVPAPWAMPPGCAFAPRCPRRLSACDTIPPPLVGEDHTASCHNPLGESAEAPAANA